MSWLELSRAELRRLVRFVARLGRQNPIILLLLVAGAGGFLWLAAGAGVTAASLAAFDPVLTVLLLFLFATGGLVGLTTATAAPRFEDLDAQVAAAPIPPTFAFLGATAIPLLVVWTISAAPVFAFGWALFRELGADPPWLGGVVLAAGQILASMTGAAAAEAIRGRSDARGATLGSIGVLSGLVGGCIFAALSEAPWWSWFAGALMRGGTVEAPSLWLVLLVIGALAAFVFWCWSAAGAVPTRRTRVSGVVRSQPMGTGLFETLARALVLRALRDRRIVGLALVALGFGVIAPLAAGVVLGAQSQVLVPFVAVVVALNAAALPIALSADVAAGAWLWRTIPTTSRRFGFAWWVIASVIACGFSALALAPTAALYVHQIELVLVLAVMLAPIPAAVARLLPWRYDSAILQLLTGVLLLVAYSIGVNEVLWIGERVTRLAGDLPLAREIAFAAAFVSIALPSALICMFSPWRQT
ncbi:MAG: hypothetical protein M3T56_04580 [Chloroflexota bacterium]|nr:hypothetical protein [Chloroflexota bacterium]